MHHSSSFSGAVFSPRPFFVLALLPLLVLCGRADLLGVLDGISPDGWVHGWAFDKEAPAASISVDLRVDGQPAGAFPADQSRSDVNEAHHIDGDHGFHFRLPERFRSGRLHAIQLFAGGRELTNSPLGFKPGHRAHSARPPNPNLTIRGPVHGKPLLLRTTGQFAGAIDSVIWDGVEFIDRYDHGRQLQSASNFRLPGEPWAPECYNPTEAGSQHDRRKPTSTSRCLASHATSNRLETVVQMAFWLAPGGESPVCERAQTTTARSNHVLYKQVVIQPTHLELDITFHVPTNEVFTYQQFEILTGYMPAAFSEFRAWNPTTQRDQPLSDGPGEQRLPVFLSTPSGSHAMGILATHADKRPEPITFGRFRFAPQKVVKWNAVHRVGQPRDIDPKPSGAFRYRCLVPMGSTADVTTFLRTR